MQKSPRNPATSDVQNEKAEDFRTHRKGNRNRENGGTQILMQLVHQAM